MNALTKEKTLSLKKHYLRLNSKRLLRCIDSLPNIHQDFISLIPLMFHMNEAHLPGYIDAEVPVCINGFSPNQETKAAGKRLIDVKFKVVNKLALSFNIQSIFIVNSNGALAAKEHFEELNVCVFINPELKNKAKALLVEKAKLIKDWAAGKNIITEIGIYNANDVNLMPITIDPEITHKDKSINQQLLLDEFYYSSILLAGKSPIWWLIPAENEVDYKQTVKQLIDNSFIDEFEFIDFGGLTSNSPENSNSTENFIESLILQQFNHLENPYATILKSILMEAYLSSLPNIEFASLTLKKMLHAGKMKDEHLDPSVIILEKIEDYLINTQQSSRLKFVQRCFYIKAKEARNETIKLRASEWHIALIEKVKQRFDWADNEFKFLEQRVDWTITDIAAERNQLVTSLYENYQVYDKYIQSNKQFKSCSASLQLLKIGLDNAFEQYDGKIDYLNPHISNTPQNKKQLTIIHIINKAKQDNWLLYPGSVTPETSKETQSIKHSHNILDIIAWGYFNKIIVRESFIHLYSKTSSITDKILRNVVELFDDSFKEKELAKVSYDDLIKPAKVQNVALFVNFDMDSFKQFKKKGQEFATEHFDALNYSSRKINITQSFQLISFDSHNKAIYTSLNDGTNSFIQCIINCLGWMFDKHHKSAFKLLVFSDDSGRELVVHKRIETVFQGILRFFDSHPEPKAIRYIIQVDNINLIFYLKKNKPHFLRVKNFQEMEALFHLPQTTPCSIKFGSGFHRNSYFPIIFDLSKMYRIQLFYVVEDGKIDIFIVDERGSLFHQVIDNPDLVVGRLIQRYIEFLHFTIKHIKNIIPDFDASGEKSNIPCYQLKKNKDDVIKAIINEFKDYSSDSFFNIKVVVETIDSKIKIKALCDEHVFSSSEHGNKVFALLSQYILSKREDGANYPIYITDLDATPAILGLKKASQIQTLHFLNNKIKLEKKLR